MKKLLTIALTAALLLTAASLLALNVAAEDHEETFRYGNADVALTLVEDCTSVTAETFLNWGTMTGVNEALCINTAGAAFTDAYKIKTNMFGSADLGSAQNIVFSITDNRSDGDIFFGFQPYSPSLTVNDGNLFTGWIEDAPILLVKEDGTCKEAAKAPSLDVANGRATYCIPMGFEGYLVFPVAALVVHGDWYNTHFVDGGADITSLGFHVALDDATYAEFSIDDVFVCGELPDYQAPVKETEAPTAAPTQPETNAPTEPETSAPTPSETDALTSPVTDAPTAPESLETNAASSTTTVGGADEPAGGCASAITAFALLPVLAGAVLTLRRKD